MTTPTPGASAPLVFHSTQFDIVDHNGQPWLRLPQIEGALGYANSGKALSELYRRNAAEFTPSMTAVVKLPDLHPQNEGAGQLRETRIFSLRGAHLLGMFARTQVDLLAASRGRIPSVTAVERGRERLVQRGLLEDAVKDWWRIKVPAMRAALETTEECISLAVHGLISPYLTRLDQILSLNPAPLPDVLNQFRLKGPSSPEL